MNNRFYGVLFFLTAMLSVVVPLSICRGEPLPSGDKIAEKVNSRPEGKTLVRSLDMELINRRGQTRKRQTVSYRKYFGDERRSVIFYISPGNVKGTAFLTWDYPSTDRDDNQWIYLPASRKVRRISASKKGDYFLGTDFTYDDMRTEGKPHIKDYRYKTLGKENIDGHPCYKVEGTPVNERIAELYGYGRVVQWIDPEIWMARKTMTWDIRGNELKIINFSDIKQVDGIWTAHRLEAKNIKTGHKTVFTFSNVRYNQPVDDNLFRQETLPRGLR
jgi:outer membrane lipoprotein-sorting protein